MFTFFLIGLKYLHKTTINEMVLRELLKNRIDINHFLIIIDNHYQVVTIIS